MNYWKKTKKELIGMLKKQEKISADLGAEIGVVRLQNDVLTVTNEELSKGQAQQTGNESLELQIKQLRKNCEQLSEDAKISTRLRRVAEDQCVETQGRNLLLKKLLTEEWGEL